MYIVFHCETSLMPVVKGACGFLQRSWVIEVVVKFPVLVNELLFLEIVCAPLSAIANDGC